MKTPHKHAAIIKAWADGEAIEYCINGNWYPIGEQPSFFYHSVFRIKPTPKPDRVYYGVFEKEDVLGACSMIGSAFTKYNDGCDQIKLTFDGATGKLKTAEVL